LIPDEPKEAHQLNQSNHQIIKSSNQSIKSSNQSNQSIKSINLIKSVNNQINQIEWLIDYCDVRVCVCVSIHRGGFGNQSERERVI
jgi:hypothetical protein